MAINENDVKSAAGPVVGQMAEKLSQAQADQNAAKVPGIQWNLGNGGLFAAPIGRGLGSEYLTKLTAALTEIYKQSNENVEMSLLTIDNVNDTALNFSAVIVCLKNKKQPGVGYHVLVVEATGDKIAPVIEQYNNNPVEVMRLTSDALNDILRRKCQEKVKAAYPGEETFMVDGCVVPRNFNPEDKYHVHRLALNAGLACGTELQVKSKTFSDINLYSAQGDMNLVIDVAFQNQQLEDAVGEPMRSDFLINFKAQKRQEQGRNAQLAINSGDKENRLAEASGFIDLVWAPVQAVGGFNAWQAPVAIPQNQKYVARAVITNLASNFSYTPGAMLMALLTTLSLRENNNWFQAFRPMPVNSNDVDLRDIGALNIEANLMNDPSNVGQRIDTKSASFGLEDLGQLLSAMIRPGLVISLDVPECGPQTWYTSLYSAAASKSNAATRLIFQAAQELTNGNFSKYFVENSPMFTDVGNRVHLGHWIDRNGNRRDIRDIDLVAVANLMGERNPLSLRDWSDTLTRTEYPLNQRLAARKKIIHGLTNETAEFTGFAQRITFTSQFLDALAKGAQDANLAVRINTPLSASDFNNQRGVAGFVNDALLAPNQSFTSNGNFGYNGNFANPQFGGNYRY